MVEVGAGSTGSFFEPEASPGRTGADPDVSVPTP